MGCVLFFSRFTTELPIPIRIYGDNGDGIGTIHLVNFIFMFYRCVKNRIVRIDFQ